MIFIIFLIHLIRSVECPSNYPNCYIDEAVTSDINIEKANLYVNRCTFDGLTGSGSSSVSGSANNGGAIYLYCTSGTTQICYIISSKFNNCHAASGGAIYFKHAQLSKDKLRFDVNDCDFNENEATEDGGAIHFFANLGIIHSCRFTDNKCAKGSDLYYKQNSSKGPYASDNFSLIIEDCKFNRTTQSSSLVYIDSIITNLFIYFTNNAVIFSEMSDSYFFGFSNDNLYQQNEIKCQSNCISPNKKYIYSIDHFSSGFSNEECIVTPPINPTEAPINPTEAPINPTDKPADPTLTLTPTPNTPEEPIECPSNYPNCYIDEAVTSDINIEKANLYVNRCTFDGLTGSGSSSVSGSANNGGAIYLYCTSGTTQICYIISSKFNNCHAASGGAIYFKHAQLSKDKLRFDVNDCDFNENEATEDGGAIHFFANLGIIHSCRFTDNKCAKGSDLYYKQNSSKGPYASDNFSLIIEDCKFNRTTQSSSLVYIDSIITNLFIYFTNNAVIFSEMSDSYFFGFSNDNLYQQNEIKCQSNCISPNKKYIYSIDHFSSGFSNEECIVTPPINPTEAPINPTEAPINPTEAPINPTEAPINPTEAPINPTEAPINPTDKPADPTLTLTPTPNTPEEPIECPSNYPNCYIDEAVTSDINIEKANLYVNRCTFDGLTGSGSSSVSGSANNGGAIYLYCTSGTTQICYIISSKFNNCHAASGGAIYFKHAQLSKDKLRFDVNDCDFNENEATEDGGAIHFFANLGIIHSCRFTDNKCAKGSDLYYKQNSSKGPYASDNFSLIIEDCKFNRTTQSSSLVYIDSIITNLFIYFTNNAVIFSEMSDSYFFGFSNDNLYQQNEIKCQSNCISPNKKYIYSIDHFSSGFSNEECIVTPPINPTEAPINPTEAPINPTDKPADPTLTLTPTPNTPEEPIECPSNYPNCYIDEAVTSDINIEKANLYVNRCTFDGLTGSGSSSVSGSANNGGAIYLYCTSGTTQICYIISSKFNNCHAASGGAIYFKHAQLSKDKLRFDVNDCDFNENEATEDGGAIHFFANLGIIHSCRFTDNKCAKGSDLYYKQNSSKGPYASDNFSLIIEDCKFNRTTQSSSLVYIDSIITNLFIYFTNNAVIFSEMSDSYFFGFSNDNLYQQNEIKCQSNCISPNKKYIYSIDHFSSGFSNEECIVTPPINPTEAPINPTEAPINPTDKPADPTLTLTPTPNTPEEPIECPSNYPNCYIDEAVTSDINIEKANLYVNRCTFDGLTGSGSSSVSGSANNGGAIYLYCTSGTTQICYIISSKFNNCHAASGGAIYFKHAQLSKDKLRFDVNDCDFNENEATEDGGAIHFFANLGIIHSCRFTDNKCAKGSDLYYKQNSSKGPYASDNFSLIIEDCKFNRTTQSSSLVYIDSIITNLFIYFTNNAVIFSEMSDSYFFGFSNDNLYQQNEIKCQSNCISPNKKYIYSIDHFSSGFSNEECIVTPPINPTEAPINPTEAPINPTDKPADPTLTLTPTPNTPEEPIECPSNYPNCYIDEAVTSDINIEKANLYVNRCTFDGLTGSGSSSVSGSANNGGAIYLYCTSGTTQICYIISSKFNNCHAASGGAIYFKHAQLSKDKLRFDVNDCDFNENEATEDGGAIHFFANLGIIHSCRFTDNKCAKGSDLYYKRNSSKGPYASDNFSLIIEDCKFNRTTQSSSLVYIDSIITNLFIYFTNNAVIFSEMSDSYFFGFSNDNLYQQNEIKCQSNCISPNKKYIYSIDHFSSGFSNEECIVTPPINPTEAPINPTEAPINPTEAPINPTEAPINPTEAPINPTEAPINPTEAPINPTEAPINPTDKPADPTLTLTPTPNTPEEPIECPSNYPNCYIDEAVTSDINIEKANLYVNRCTFDGLTGSGSSSVSGSANNGGAIYLYCTSGTTQICYIISSKFNNCHAASGGAIYFKHAQLSKDKLRFDVNDCDFNENEATEDGGAIHFFANLGIIHSCRFTDNKCAKGSDLYYKQNSSKGPYASDNFSLIIEDCKFNRTTQSSSLVYIDSIITNLFIYFTNNAVIFSEMSDSYFFGFSNDNLYQQNEIKCQSNCISPNKKYIYSIDHFSSGFSNEECIVTPPINPTEAPINPTEAPINPTEAPINLTEAPINPTETPINPTDKPADPTLTLTPTPNTPEEPIECPSNYPNCYIDEAVTSDINIEKANLYVNRCTFDGLTGSGSSSVSGSANNGGAIYLYCTSGTTQICYIISSKFNNCHAASGGAIYFKHAQLSKDKLRFDVNDCDFNENEATEDGGAIHFFANLGIIHSCRFTDNKCAKGSDLYYKRNSSKGPYASDNFSLIIEDCKFNRTTQSSSLVYIDSIITNLFIYFTNNAVIFSEMSDSYFFGFSNDNLYQQNEIKCQSNCISPNKKYIYSIDHFSSGFSNEECIVTPPINPTEAPINPTEAPINPTDKPADPTLTLTPTPNTPEEPIECPSNYPNCYIDEAVTSDINIEKANLYVNRCTFDGLTGSGSSSVSGSANNGGAIYLYCTSGTTQICYIISSKFNNCHAASGGAIYFKHAQLSKDKLRFDVNDCDFNENEATEDGGAIHFFANLGIIHSCRFTDNKCAKGSDLYYKQNSSKGPYASDNFSLIIEDCKFNRTTQSSSLVYIDSIITNLFIYFTNNAVIFSEMSDSYFFGFSNDNLYQQNEIKCQSNCISPNKKYIYSIDHFSSGFSNEECIVTPPINPTEAPINPTEAPINPTDKPADPTLTLTPTPNTPEEPIECPSNYPNCYIDEAVTSDINIEKANLYVNRCTFDGLTGSGSSSVSGSANNGGAIYLYCTSGTTQICYIISSKFNNCHAASGGAIYFKHAQLSKDKLRFDVNDCDFNENEATEDGGAIHFFANLGIIHSCRFTDNKCAKGSDLYYKRNSSKGPYASDNFSLIIEDCKFNRTTQSSSLVYIDSIITNLFIYFTNNAVIFSEMSDSYFFGFSNDNLYQQNEIKCQSNCISPNKKYIYSIDHFSSGFSNEECIVTPPINPTEAPINPTEAPINPTEAPINPTDKPADPTLTLTPTPNTPEEPIECPSNYPNCYIDEAVTSDINIEKANLYVNRCTFDGLTGSGSSSVSGSANNGGAIYLYCTSGTTQICYIISSKFNNCHAASGGAIYFKHAQLSKDKLRFDVNDCDFNENEATEDGGAIHFFANLGIIHSCRFTDNKCAKGSDLYYKRNSSKGPYASDNFSLIIEDCKFNRTTQSSSLVYIDSIITNLFIYFTNNAVIFSEMSDSYFFGFSNDNLYQQNEIKCQSNCISPNKKYIYSIDHFSSGFSNEECIVTPPINPTEAPINPTEAPINPTNKPVGPSVCPSKPSGPVDDLSSNPTSYTNKSVIYGCNLEISSKIISDQHIVHLYQCTFNGLQDESSEGGGAIYIMTTSKGPTNKTCIIEDCTFSNCQSTKGGALSIVTAQPTRFFSILRSKFNNNKAIGEGGAIYFHAVYSTIDSCEFTNNQAGSGNGSEIYFLCKESEGGISTNPFLIQNSKFEVNEADTSSNMIYLDWIKSSDFEFKKNEVRITSTNNNYLFSSKGDLNTGRMTIESNCISDKSRLCESNNIALHDKITPGFPTICGSILPPTEGPINPTETPNNPTEAPINPTEGPINPTYTPNNPTEAPINPTYTPNNPTEAPINPTEISNTPIISGPIDDELTVDQTINFTGDSVEFNKNGYKVDEKDISVTDKKAEIILINPMKGLSLIKINTTTEKPEKAVFVSPTTKNTDAIILTPTDGSNDYGQGEIGIHANSNLNNIILQTEKVPLNIYSNEASDVSFKLEKSTNESTIYLNHLIMNDGSLQMKVPDEVETIQFIVVEVYKLDKIEALRSNKEQIETRIDELRLRSGSHLTLASTNIRKVIKASPRSKLSIEGSAAFNNETKIEMTETSFINFGSSNVEGIISEIKLSENGTDVNHLQEDESIIPLICGDNFKCSDWKDNFVGNIKYIAAKCISYNNQECLAATNKPVVVDKHSGNKSLPTGAIIAIVVVVVVVIAAILIVIILVKKKSNYNYNHFNDDAFQGEIEGDNRSVESFGENSLNNSSLTEEFDNILYNSADQHHSSSDDPFMKEFEDNSA